MGRLTLTKLLMFGPIGFLALAAAVEDLVSWAGDIVATAACLRFGLLAASTQLSWVQGDWGIWRHFGGVDRCCCLKVRNGRREVQRLRLRGLVSWRPRKRINFYGVCWAKFGVVDQTSKPRDLQSWGGSRTTWVAFTWRDFGSLIHFEAGAQSECFVVN